MKTAIMVDGGFYLKQARKLFGEKTAAERATELLTYCHRHIPEDHSLYRIFFYNCPPSNKIVYHPLLKSSINLGKSPLYKWTNAFHLALTSKRKVALRMGELLEGSTGYIIHPDALKRLCRKEITVDDLTEQDFYLDIQQKGVDMRIGLDIASLAQKRLADQIILIAGDSDFVPAAKHARREGIDFILDPMWHTIKPSLNEHIDGLQSKVGKPPANQNDPLHKGG
ncbi:MAG: NYN domain-containing protein [Peptococcaceae bacterium]|jgi:uncharacterized LabA/DUF88 family protein|nr:NYN domain-containing protein [Peptococcaceae bacterium]